MEKQVATTIMEERKELMVSPSHDSKPILRIAHFLEPTSTLTGAPPFELPLNAFRSEPKVSFKCWREPIKNWRKWVERMRPLHQSTWKKAGIYEAIITSTYILRKNEDIVLGFAERWCPETNTFIFPWGEATITLEDIMILGGYSVLGESVLAPIKTEVQIKKKLKKARRNITEVRSNKVSHYKWINNFMNTGSEIEHEAFLVLWLSTYVFPVAYTVVSRHVHDMAIHLARGTRIALAPAVLACLYRDLTLLTQENFGSNKKKTENKELILWSPMQLVQVWAWERFPKVQPKPNPIQDGEPIMARWKNAMKYSDIRSAIDTAYESFIWRPYAVLKNSWQIRKFYGKMENTIEVCSDTMHEDFESFAKILRVSELVGLNCVELYCPHRVSMQFGMDQDIPGQVARFNKNSEVAWGNYTRPIEDEIMYIPSRLFQSAVTTRYLEWRKRSKSDQRSVDIDNKKRKRSTENNSSFFEIKEIKPNKSPSRSKVNESSKEMRNDNVIEILDDESPSPCVATQKPSSSSDGANVKVHTEFGENTDIVHGDIDVEESNQLLDDSSKKKGEVMGDNEGESDDELIMKLDARISRLESLVAMLNEE